jgi:hypothetical protein
MVKVVTAKPDTLVLMNCIPLILAPHRQGVGFPDSHPFVAGGLSGQGGIIWVNPHLLYIQEFYVASLIWLVLKKTAIICIKPIGGLITPWLTSCSLELAG